MSSEQIKWAGAAGMHIVKGLPAYLALLIGYLGLQTWQRQLQGTAKYDAARSLIRATLKVQSSIESARLGPFHLARNAPPEGLRILSEAAKSQYEELKNAQIEFEAAQLEAQVVWGDKSRKTLNDLATKLKAETALVQFSLWAVLQIETGNTKPLKMESHFTLLDGKKEDSFGKEVDRLVQKLTEVAKPYLGSR